jgi:DeoR/GlpR family transcriptional regulator of sugar metabolism
MLKKSHKVEDLRRELKDTLRSFPRAKTAKLAILFKVSVSTIKRQIKALQDAGELIRTGSDKNVFWQVVEKETEQ